MVLASEINLTGEITEVAYDVTDGPYTDGLFWNFEMRLCHTPLDELTDNFDDNYSGNTPVLVADDDPLNITTGDGWWAVPDFTPFDYNGSDNLIIEIRWQDDNEVSVYMWFFDAGTNRFLLAKGYDAETGSVSSKMNRFRLAINTSGLESASLGRIKTTFR
ncbi:MAG: hypothetical protein GY771_17030 [bacterium]|nr:hypothetical protein [bacterium]